MNRAFILIALIFLTVSSLSCINLRAETINNTCPSSLAVEQKINQYQQHISNSYEITQVIKKSIPYAIIISLVIVILLLSHHFHGNKQDMLRFIYGTDNLAPISLIVFGSLFNLLELLVMLVLGGLPSSSDLFPLVMYYATSWKTWVFLIGLIGLLTKEQRLSGGRKNIGVIRSFFTNKGYQMPIWLILIGVVWIVDVATKVLPSLLKWGKPPGTVTFCIRPTPVDKLPLSEIGSYFVTEPSFILIVVGVSLILLKWIILVMHR